MHLRVVVEVAVDIARASRRRRLARDEARIIRLLAFTPGADAACPCLERSVAVPAAVELRLAMQPYVDEIGGDVLAQGPLPGGVCHHERDVVATKDIDEALVEKRVVPD